MLRFTALTLCCLAILAACAPTGAPPAPAPEIPSIPLPEMNPPPAEEAATQRTEFSTLHPSFRFSGEIPKGWKVELVQAITALNLYDPSFPAASTLEQAQIFLRTFEADRFLTLQTVEILAREETEIRGRPAVRYEIRKKDGASDFPHQPSWRSAQHRLTDVRLTNASPSLFYVFAHRPELPEETFAQFLTSLRFHNDPESFHPPLPRLAERHIVKPFGIKISPEDSPVQPERFSGFHTGMDFEVFADEREEKEIPIAALCGGLLRTKQRSEGYGGVAVQECLLGDEPVTVIYGHLALQSIEANIGTYLAPGERIGFLGEEKSPDTDGERKHLHLGVHRGKEIVLAGYVRSEAELSAWIDPEQLLRLP